MKYLLVEMAIEEGEKVPHIIYMGEFERIEDALGAKIHAERLNPGMAFAFQIMAVLS